MAFIRTIPEAEASGKLKQLYDQKAAEKGYVPDHLKAISLRPEAVEAWEHLLASTRSNLDSRRYGLVTIAVASALKCTYCMVYHAGMLRSTLFSDDELLLIVRDFHTAHLSPSEVAMMEYAQKTALHAHEVSPEDISNLRRHGFSDEEILDIALAAAARCFFGKFLDAVGAEPTHEAAQLPTRLRKELAVGRPLRAG